MKVETGPEDFGSIGGTHLGDENDAPKGIRPPFSGNCDACDGRGYFRGPAMTTGQGWITCPICKGTGN